MRVDDFDFDLPTGLIATRPARPRDSARLLTVDGGAGAEGLADRAMAELPGLLTPSDVMVFNDTRVIPARLTGRRGQAAVEVTLHKRVASGRWLAFARPARKLRPGDSIDFAPGFAAEVVARGEGGEVDLEFSLSDEALSAALQIHGLMPLPPYIASRRPPDAQDHADYQTIFAARDGAVAAPTAGLHFTEALVAAIGERGVRTVQVTLHVGAGTFLPVRVKDTGAHKMHAEHGEVNGAAAAAINGARAAGGRVVAVGTTSLRLLESAVDENGVVAPFSGETDLFITPGFEFRAVDLLLTNFHLPKSTLFMLACAFAGHETMLAAYAHAVGKRYRFYSYGDATLLYPETRS